MEIVLCLYGFLVWQNQGGDITSHDIQYTGRQGTIRVVTFYATLEKVGLDGQPFLAFAFSYADIFRLSRKYCVSGAANSKLSTLISPFISSMEPPVKSALTLTDISVSS